MAGFSTFLFSARQKNPSGPNAEGPPVKDGSVLGMSFCPVSCADSVDRSTPIASAASVTVDADQGVNLQADRHTDPF
jgi:hypothetical protein